MEGNGKGKALGTQRWMEGALERKAGRMDKERETNAGESRCKDGRTAGRGDETAVKKTRGREREVDQEEGKGETGQKGGDPRKGQGKEPLDQPCTRNSSALAFGRWPATQTDAAARSPEINHYPNPSDPCGA